MKTADGKDVKPKITQVQSPLRLLLIVIAVIFFIEFGIMLLVVDLLPLSETVEAVVDASVLIILLFPALYFLIFRPLIASLSQIQQKDLELKKSFAELEMGVEQRTAQLSLKSTMLDNATDAVFVSDLNGNLLFVNKAAYEARGYSKEEILSITVQKLDTPEFAELMAKRFQNMLKTGEPSVFESAHYKKDGSIMPVEVNARLIDYEGQKAIMGFVRDITERKRAKELSDALNTINAKISATLDFDRIMQSVVGKAAKALGSEASWITMFEDEKIVVKQVCCLPSVLIGKIFSRNDAKATYNAAKAKKVFVSNDSLKDERLNKETVRRFRLKSILSVPLVVRGNTIGILYFTNHTKAVPFSDLQIDFANKLAASLSLALESARLYEAQLNIAETLQEALLQAPEKIPGLEFGYLYRPASEEARVGGDFYDIFELEHNKVGVLVGDVSGKGLKAATLTSLVENTIKAYAYQEESPAAIIDKANDVVVKQTSPGSFITVFFAIIDTETRKLRYCNAGHPLPIINKKTEEAFFLTTNSTAIGIFPEEEFIEGQETLQKGDSLTLYTDGIVEARCKDGHLFSDERLLQVVNKFSDKPLAEIPQLIFDKVMQCTVGTLADDVVILTVGLK